MKVNQRKIVTLAMMAAVAFVAVCIGRLPISPLPFLKYDPKDIIIVIGGFLFGPLSAALISLVVSLVEMVTISDTGVIGLIMNVLGTCSFACVASAVYKYRPNLKNAVTGLLCGLATMTAVMLLWNYFIIFLPFNLIKGGLNMAAALLLYKPVVGALRKARLVPPSQQEKGKRNWGIILAALALLATCVLAALVFGGVL